MLTPSPRPNSLVSATLVVSLLVSAPVLASKALTCVPSTLKAGDTLVLTIPTPHSGDLWVSTPNGEGFFLVFPPETPAEFRPAEAAQPLVCHGTLSRLWADSALRQGP
jgi:hypothetical protein